MLDKIKEVFYRCYFRDLLYCSIKASLYLFYKFNLKKMKQIFLIFECDNRLQNKVLIDCFTLKNKTITAITNIIINFDEEISEHNLHHL